MQSLQHRSPYTQDRDSKKGGNFVKRDFSSAAVCLGSFSRIRFDPKSVSRYFPEASSITSLRSGLVSFFNDPER